jgi:hypothetical protein
LAFDGSLGREQAIRAKLFAGSATVAGRIRLFRLSRARRSLESGLASGRARESACIIDLDASGFIAIRPTPFSAYSSPM